MVASKFLSLAIALVAFFGTIVYSGYDTVQRERAWEDFMEVFAVAAQEVSPEVTPSVSPVPSVTPTPQPQEPTPTPTLQTPTETPAPTDSPNSGGNSNSDFFLKMDGIPGESTDISHKDWIEVLSYSFGLTNKGGGVFGGGSSSGKAVFNDFTITTRMDKSSPLLFQYAASGKHIPEVIISARKKGEVKQDYLIIKMNDVLITSYQTGGSDGDPIPTESLSLNFSKIEIEYRQQKSDGSLGTPIKAGWNVKLNRAL